MATAANPTSYSETLRKIRQSIVAFDLFAIFVSVALSSFLLVGRVLEGMGEHDLRYLLIPILPMIWLLELRARSAWSLVNIESLRNSLSSLLRAGYRATISVGFLAYILKEPISRLWFVTSTLLILGLLLVNRCVFYYLFDRTYDKGLIEKYLLLSNAGQLVDESKIPARHKNPNHHRIFFRIEPPKEEDRKKWIESTRDLIEREQLDGIVIMPGTITDAGLLSEITKMYQLGITGILMNTTLANEINLFYPIPHLNWIRIQEPHITNSGMVLKRVFDIFFSTIAIFLLSPLFLLTALAIKLTSKGPVLYGENRIGKDSKEFYFPKFRTMYTDAAAMRAAVIGRPDTEIANRYKSDPRITKVGRFLRRWSLDELPQFFCVLIGTMSVVGPRPILKEEFELVDKKSAYRFLAKPGLTGVWQVSGRKEVSWDDRMAMDYSYVRNWTFAGDLVLIVQTFSAIFSGRGSY